MFSRTLPLNSHFFAAGLLFAILSCTTSDSQFIEPEEANTNIMVGIALKDQECGTLHVMNWFVYSDARKEHVDACLAEILAQDCNNWKISSQLPTSCLSIQIDL